jgi:hypothetical protein
MHDISQILREFMAQCVHGFSSKNVTRRTQQPGKLNVTAPLPAHMRAAFEMLGFEEREARDPFAPFGGGK